MTAAVTVLRPLAVPDTKQKSSYQGNEFQCALLQQAHLYLSKVEKSNPQTDGVRTSRPMQYRVAPAGMTVQPGWSTLRLARSNKYRNLLPTKPAMRT